MTFTIGQPQTRATTTLACGYEYFGFQPLVVIFFVFLSFYIKSIPPGKSSRYCVEVVFNVGFCNIITGH
jgi:hypothetical protein